MVAPSCAANAHRISGNLGTQQCTGLQNAENHLRNPSENKWLGYLWKLFWGLQPRCGLPSCEATEPWFASDGEEVRWKTAKTSDQTKKNDETCPFQCGQTMGKTPNKDQKNVWFLEIESSLQSLHTRLCLSRDWLCSWAQDLGFYALCPGRVQLQKVLHLVTHCLEQHHIISVGIWP